MTFDDEKDYYMRMIKEWARVLASLMFGKKYTSVELPDENKYEVSGSTLDDFTDMVDRGEINEAENQILDGLDYNNKEEIMAVVAFYEYVCDKGTEFLVANDYSQEEVVDGMRSLTEKAGYAGICDILTEK